MIKESDNARRGRASRNKGARSERELAAILNDKGFNVHRGYVFHHQSDIVGLDGIHPEVKRVEKLNIHKAMEQAKEEAEKRQDGKPAVFFRRDRGEWLVCVQLDTFIEMYKAWKGKHEDDDT